MSWLGNLRISVRMSILVGLAFVGLAGVLGIYLFADSRVAHLQAQSEELDEIREEGAAIRLGVFDMRRREKDFLLRNDETYAKQYRDAEKHVEHELKRMRAAPVAQPVVNHLDSLIAGVARHAAEFDKVVKAQESIGFDQNKGALAAVRKAVHDVEAKVNALGRADLLASLLMMRRHEKDFLLREEKKY